MGNDFNKIDFAVAEKPKVVIQHSMGLSLHLSTETRVKDPFQ